MKVKVIEKENNKTVYEVLEPLCCGYTWKLTRIKGQGTYARICAEDSSSDDIYIVVEEFDSEAYPQSRDWWDSAHPQEIVSRAWKDIKAEYPHVVK